MCSAFKFKTLLFHCVLLIIIDRSVGVGDGVKVGVDIDNIAGIFDIDGVDDYLGVLDDLGDAGNFSELGTITGRNDPSKLGYLENNLNGKIMRDVATPFYYFIANNIEKYRRANEIPIDDIECLNDLQHLGNEIDQGSVSALKFLDAWGLLPSGILTGNTKSLGNFDECININHIYTTNHNIQGKYCLAQFPMVKNRMGGSLPSGAFNIKIGVCMPASCSPSRMDMLIKLFLKQYLNLNVGNIDLVQEQTCTTSDKEPFTPLAIATIVILSILGILVVVCTIYDYFFTKQGNNLNSFLKAFSARWNARILFQIRTEYNPNVIPCLHGIRCFSLAWVVFGHGFIAVAMAPNINTVTVYNWLETPFSMLIQHAPFSVDTFFFVSGLLLVMIALREMGKASGKLNVPLMYVHRYLRLTPAVGIAIMVYLGLLPYLADGPLWKSGTFFFDNYANCEDHWWETLLYVQNYATRKMCLGHSWYLAADMQLFILSPILLVSLWKWGKKAIGGIFVLLILLSACLFSMIIIKKYSLFMLNSGGPKFSHEIYFYTHVRAAPWLVGIMFGYFLHIKKGKTIQLSKLSVYCGWIIALILLMIPLFVLYPKSHWNAADLTSVEEAFYVTFTRISWPLGLCWVVFACQFGYGGMANSILSSPLWQPLSKLSYSAYIWHALILYINAGRVRTNTYFSDYDAMLRFWSDFGFVILFSLFMYLLVEAPFAGLEMMLMPNRKRTVINAPKEAKTDMKTAPIDEKLPTKFIPRNDDTV